MKAAFLIPIALIAISASARENLADGRVRDSGLIIPLDDSNCYLRNPDGQVEIRWTNKTEVALEANTRLLSAIKDGVFPYRIQATKQHVDFAIPDGPVTGIRTLRNANQLETALQEAADEKWIAETGLVVRFGEKLPQQLPTKDDLRFVGAWDHAANPRTLTINGEAYEISLKKGGQTNALLFGLLESSACKPFVNRATVIGKLEGDVIIADEIHILPIGDQTALDDPALPRYLFIGDSISGNYDRGLREALAGKFNLHHPPTNCGPSSKGKASIVEWLGAYDQPGRKWDVISFNFGHWDAGNSKDEYQANLEAVIAELKKTRAHLVWVTTCPVPNGSGLVGGLNEDGRAPGRKGGVMGKFLNPWAMEVLASYRDITVCDQWRFVKQNEGDLYLDWWAGDNVHFGGEQADALGQLLAEHVLKMTQNQ
ncbi:MAG: hypothetical protein ACI8UO_002490 [Verrucomicrobiales bacterium]|jgi:hypothetical protein